MPNLSPLINIDAFNDIYEIIKDRVINERVYRTDANPDEILGSASLPYTQAYIQNLTTTTGGSLTGPGWVIDTDSASFNGTLHSDGVLSTDNNLSVAGTTTLTGAITASSTLTVSGLASLTNVNVSKTIGESGTSGSWYINNTGLAKFETSLSNDGSPNIEDGWYISSSNVASADQDNYKRTGSTSELGVDRIFTNRISAESIDTNGLTVNGNLEIDPGAEAEGLITPSIKDSGDEHGSLGSGPHYWITTDGNAEFKGVLGYEVIDGEGALSTYTNSPWYITSTGASKFNNLITTGSLAVQSGNMTVGSVVSVSSTGAWFNPRLTVGQNTLNTSYNLYIDGTANITGNTYVQGTLAESSSSPRWSIDESGIIKAARVEAPLLSVTSSATICAATLEGVTTFSGDLDATGKQLKIGTITDASNINTSSITVSSVLTSTGTSNLNGVTNINGNLTVSSSGTATFNRAVDFNGNIGNGDAWYINSDGSAYFTSFSLANIDTGNIEASGTITADGNITAPNFIGDLQGSVYSYELEANDALARPIFVNQSGTSAEGFTDLYRSSKLRFSSNYTASLYYPAEGAVTNVSGIPTLLLGTSGDNSSGIEGIMGQNDRWRIMGLSSTASADSGYLEISTIDNGNEAIYMRQYSIVDGELGVKNSITLMDDLGNTVLNNLSVSSTISANQFRAADGFYVDSAEEYKENIHRTTLNAMKLLKGVDVVDFNYKSDKYKKKKIGFIADYTDELLATPEHNRMDTSNCIGILIKAVQELSDRIERLENR